MLMIVGSIETDRYLRLPAKVVRGSIPFRKNLGVAKHERVGA
jgi:hypothetical protein